MNGELLSEVFWLVTELTTEITMLVDHQNRKAMTKQRHSQRAPWKANSPTKAIAA